MEHIAACVVFLSYRFIQVASRFQACPRCASFAAPICMHQCACLIAALLVFVACSMTTGVKVQPASSRPSTNFPRIVTLRTLCQRVRLLATPAGTASRQVAHPSHLCRAGGISHDRSLRPLHLE